MHIILIYLGILAGIFLEGEMIMITSVIAAHHGYLELWIVIIVGVTATYASDTLYFFIGRNRGQEWINRRDKLKQRVDTLNRYLDKYPVLIFISYRFLYGFRTVAPLAIGLSRTKTIVFMSFSALSTLLWAAVYTSIGYISGELIKSQLGHIEHVEKYIIGVLVILGAAIYITNRIKRHRT